MASPGGHLTLVIVEGNGRVGKSLADWKRRSQYNTKMFNMFNLMDNPTFVKNGSSTQLVTDLAAAADISDCE